MLEADGFTILDLFLTTRGGGGVNLKSALVVALEIQVSLIHRKVKEVKLSYLERHLERLAKCVKLKLALSYC